MAKRTRKVRSYKLGSAKHDPNHSKKAKAKRKGYKNLKKAAGSK